jgi:chromosome segregation ATPase
MAEEDPRQEGLRARGEDAVAELANALLDNPVLNQALSAALGVGERAAQAQRRAMDAVGLPSADDLERLERRIRSLSERLEAVEDQLDEVARDTGALRRKLADREAAAEAAEQGDLEVSEAE